MNEDLLALLQEASIEIEQMWKTCDKSVGDYVLSLETAYKFVQRALQTEDRLDVYKALQKAYDVLEKEEYDDDEEESEPSLAERIGQALGLTENKIRSKLKKLVTESVLNFLNDASHWNDLRGIFNFVDDLPDKVKVDKKDDVNFDVPVKPDSKDKPLFDRGSGKTVNTFKLNKKEN
jgi:hypothetical protein